MNPCKIPSKLTVHIYIMDEIKILFPLFDLGPKTHNEKLISKNITVIIGIESRAYISDFE